MQYEAEVNLKFIIKIDSTAANEDQIPELVMNKADRLRHYLKYMAGPWIDVQDPHIAGVYNDKNQLIWYE